ncbi:MAG: VOC family protein [Acidobacteriota bacterium]
MRRISSVALIVRDCDEAIEFFAVKLGFEVLENRGIDGGERRVRLVPAGGDGPVLRLVEADADRLDRVGSQAAEEIFLVLETDDLRRDYRHFERRGVVFEGEPREERGGVGTGAVFRDLYGNRWGLFEPSS